VIKIKATLVFALVVENSTLLKEDKGKCEDDSQ